MLNAFSSLKCSNWKWNANLLYKDLLKSVHNLQKCLYLNNIDEYIYIYCTNVIKNEWFCSFCLDSSSQRVVNEIQSIESIWLINLCIPAISAHVTCAPVWSGQIDLFTTFTQTITRLVYLSEFCITIVSNFSWVFQSSQKKSKTMIMHFRFGVGG